MLAVKGSSSNRREGGRGHVTSGDVPARLRNFIWTSKKCVFTHELDFDL